MKNLIFALGALLVSFNINAGNVLKKEYHQFHYWQGCWTSNGNGQVNVYGMYDSYFPFEYNGKELQSPYGSGWYNNPSSYCDNYFTKEIINTNYTPQADFIIASQEPTWGGGVNRVTLFSTSTDFDGEVKKYTWWINGVKQAGTSSSITTGTLAGGNYDIKLKVEDNGISKLDTEYNVILNDGESYFHQSDIVEKTLYFLPWSCERDCQIY